MQTRIILCLLTLALALSGFSFYWTSVQYWGYDGVTRAKEWVSPDGRMNLQSQMPNMSTAVDYWPTGDPIRPTEHSIAEITLNRCVWSDSCMERLNMSAMVNQTDGGAYRFSVERGGTGQHRPVLFCFEDVSPGQASCPLKIDPHGVYVLTNGVYAPVTGPQ